MSHIVLQRIPASSANEIVKFVQKGFFKNEPMSEALGIVENPVVDILVLQLVKMGYCFEVIDTSKGNKRVGVLLYELCKIGAVSESTNELEKLEMAENVKIDSEFNFFVKYKALGIIQERYNTDRCIYSAILSILPEYADQGIGQKFSRCSNVLMQELNIDVAFGIYTSAYSTKIAVRNGAELIYEIKYDEYLKDGVQVLKVKPPHNAARVFVRLSEKYKEKNVKHKL